MARRVVTDRLRKIGDERKRLMAALHSFVLEAPGAAGFSTAVDQSDALKGNLEHEAILLQDFHIVLTCKVWGAGGSGRSRQQPGLIQGSVPIGPSKPCVCEDFAT